MRFDGDDFWADKYDGRFGFIVFGHSVFSEPKRFEYALGIDTGAVFGGYLTAAINEEGVWSFSQVKSNVRSPV